MNSYIKKMNEGVLLRTVKKLLSIFTLTFDSKVILLFDTLVNILIPDNNHCAKFEGCLISNKFNSFIFARILIIFIKKYLLVGYVKVKIAFVKLILTHTSLFKDRVLKYTAI